MPSDKHISRVFAQRHRQYAKRSQRAYLAALNAQVNEAAKHLPNIVAFTNAINNLSPEPVKIAFQKCYKSIIIDAGGQQLAELHRNIGQKGVFDTSFYKSDWIKRLKDWYDEHGGNRVKEITETTKRRLRDALKNSYTDNEGMSNQERAKLIYDELSDPDYNRYRSLVIARTEATTAANLGHSIAADSLSDRLNMKLEKRWIPTIDSRTRDAHELMLLSPTIDKDELFDVGGELLAQPGDPAGSAKNVINCRCRVVYTVVRNSAGRIMPNQLESVSV
jgi:hypothetical protein